MRLPRGITFRIWVGAHRYWHQFDTWPPGVGDLRDRGSQEISPSLHFPSHPPTVPNHRIFPESTQCLANPMLKALSLRSGIWSPSKSSMRGGGVFLNANTEGKILSRDKSKAHNGAPIYQVRVSGEVAQAIIDSSPTHSSAQEILEEDWVAVDARTVVPRHPKVFLPHMVPLE
ncbi:hypothetical protein FA13DRAFT_1708986 [Coprinellus micaceus]|uniref:Uncharacterized protein n=1 Tax=Coprinellus micaceus TaxID=71717 RepID=A0A4Y7TFU8_COPMI|nr:hypothetical protein FA13DRAFT_1708986 [Coprinellus micaceus]